MRKKCDYEFKIDFFWNIKILKNFNCLSETIKIEIHSDGYEKTWLKIISKILSKTLNKIFSKILNKILNKNE